MLQLPPILWSSLCPLWGTSVVVPLLGMAPWCLIPIERMAMGLSLGSTFRTAVWWYCWTFDTCRRLWHKLARSFAWWASNIPLKSACVLMIVPPSGFRKSPHDMTYSASSGPKHLRYRREKPHLYYTSFIRTNRNAWTFNFLAAFFSSSSMPFFR